MSLKLRFSSINSSLYVLWVNDILACAVYLQKGLKITYISMVDSTGFERGYNLNFIKFVFRRIKGSFFCFSNFNQSEKEFIFGKSSENKLKKILKNEKLFQFWEYVFENIHKDDESIKKDDKNTRDKPSICTWSNFNSKYKSIPFNNLNEIELFKDDPLSKMIKTEKFNNLTDLFEGLLFRTDFTTGGLLFYLKKNHRNGAVNDEKLVRDATCNIIDVNSSDRWLEFLRNECDFSNFEKAIESSVKFKNEFKIKKYKFTRCDQLEMISKNEDKKDEITENIKTYQPKKGNFLKKLTK
jgi:hypothetical protein